MMKIIMTMILIKSSILNIFRKIASLNNQFAEFVKKQAIDNPCSDWSVFVNVLLLILGIFKICERY